MSLSPEQNRYYGLYLSDPDPVPVDAGNKNAAIAAVLSLLIPGVGHLYLEEPGWALAWLVLGIFVVPIIGAPIAAAMDTNTANKARTAETYMPLYHAKEARKRREREEKEEREARERREREGRAQPSTTVVLPVQPPVSAQESSASSPAPAPKETGVHCRACGRRSPSSARFCSGCGENLQPLPGEQVYCPSCGVPYQPDARFCQGCGTARE